MIFGSHFTYHPSYSAPFFYISTGVEEHAFVTKVKFVKCFSIQVPAYRWRLRRRINYMPIRKNLWVVPYVSATRRHILDEFHLGKLYPRTHIFVATDKDFFSNSTIVVKNTIVNFNYFITGLMIEHFFCFGVLEVMVVFFL